MSYLPKTELPAHTAVLVCEVRGGELWPLGRVDLRTDDHAVISSGKKNAPLMIAPLEKALRSMHRECAAIAAAIEQMQARIADLTTDTSQP